MPAFHPRDSHPGPARFRSPTASASILLGLTGALLATACSDGVTGPAEPITELPRGLSAAEVEIVGASNAFAVDVLGEVYRASPDATVFLSPLSASMALGMTLNGTAGDTRDQMSEMLGFGTLATTDINRSYRDLIDLLRGLDPRVELTIGNAIFHHSTFAVKAAFADALRTYFDADVEGLDFDDPGAADVINAWVAAATEDRIDEIIEGPIDPLTMAFLLNAIYFKGDWTKEFDPSDSYDGPFHPAAGGTRDVRFMTKDDTLSYREAAAWQAVEMPYGGGAWAMTVAVPRDGYALTDVVDDLDTLLDPRADWIERPLQIHLPRFELQWERTLTDDLKALGMVDAFDPSLADFTPMSDVGDLYVKSVRQKTFLKVDEVGTEAAAVTVVEVGVTSCCSGPPVVRADRPFMIAIRERLSGAVLFAGLIIQAPEA
jgi:serpin B